MILPGAVLTAGLLALAVRHLLRTLGNWWPWREKQELVRAVVVGIAGAERMPGHSPCALVVAGCALGAPLPWWSEGGARLLASDGLPGARAHALHAGQAASVLAGALRRPP